MYSRRALARRFSNTPEASFCADCLQEAPGVHATHEIFNTDQGVQFTSMGLTQILENAISVDGRGRVLDNLFVEGLWRSATPLQSRRVD